MGQLGVHHIHLSAGRKITVRIARIVTEDGVLKTRIVVVVQVIKNCIGRQRRLAKRVGERDAGHVSLGYVTGIGKLPESHAARVLFSIGQIGRRKRHRHGGPHFQLDVRGHFPEVLAGEERLHRGRHELLVLLPVGVRDFRAGRWNGGVGVSRVGGVYLAAHREQRDNEKSTDGHCARTTAWSHA